MKESRLEERKAPAGTGAERYILNRLRENSASAPADASVATQLGITEQALSEIRETVMEDWYRDVRELARKQRPPTEVLVYSRSRKTLRPCGYEDWARNFGLALRPIWLKAFDSCIDLLTRTAIAHGQDIDLIDWKVIFAEAVRFCVAIEESDRCTSLYAFAFGRVGKSGEQPSADEYEAFREGVSLWRNRYSWPDQRRLDDRAEQMIRHIVRLAPDKAAQKAQLATPVELPTLKEIRSLGVITQRQAGQYLRRTTRTIRSYVKQRRLNATKTGKICCDDKLVIEIRKKYGPAVRLM